MRSPSVDDNGLTGRAFADDYPAQRTHDQCSSFQWKRAKVRAYFRRETSFTSGLFNSCLFFDSSLVELRLK